MVGQWHYDGRGERGEGRGERGEGHHPITPIYLVASSMNRSISSSVLNTLGEIRAVFSP